MTPEAIDDLKARFRCMDRINGFLKDIWKQKGDRNFVRESLKTPFLAETSICVHPLGVRTLAWHIERLLKVNPRTPYSIGLKKSPITKSFVAKKIISFCIESGGFY